MRVLVGCEESGVVREAFRRRGHEAWSNDLIPSRDGSPNHLQMDVRDAICFNGPWDIIIIHYDCTAMAVSGNRWYGTDMPRNRERKAALIEAHNIWWFAKDRARVGCCFENPVSVLWGLIGKPQYIQPWQFGHGETKRTGLRLHNLPELKPTRIVPGREQRVWRMAPSPNRKRDRSETYLGIAEAMAEQWGSMTKRAAGGFDNDTVA